MDVLWAALCVSMSAAGSAEVVRVDWSVAAGATSEIAAVRRAYVTAANGDHAALPAFYQPDALAILDENGLLRGADGLARYFARGRSASGSGAAVTLTPLRFEIEGDLGSESGSFVETLEDARGRTVVEGLYVTIYSRGEGGRWRIAMELRTTSGSPGSSEPAAEGGGR